MPHEYRCTQCRSVAPRRDRREDAEADQAAHRDAAHGGLTPMDGDHIDRVHADGRGDGTWPTGSVIAAVVVLLLVLSKCVGG